MPRTNSFIVHGPQGCGKTMHAQRIAKDLGCDKIVDSDTCMSHRSVYAQFEPQAGTLYLTNEPPPRWFHGHPRVLKFDVVMQQILDPRRAAQGKAQEASA